MSDTGIIRKTTTSVRLPAVDAAPPPVTPRHKFWIVGDDSASGDGPPSASAFADLDDATSNIPATYGMVALALDGAVAITGDAVRPLRVKLAGMEVENAQLRGTIAELRAKLSEIDFVVERLKIDRRGPPGVKGERGRDGRDGPPGRGERGERGEKGAPAPVITAWEARPEAFEIVPVFSTGERGPPIALLALFQAYDAATSVLDDRDLATAAVEARDLAEREAEAARWAK